MIINKNERSWAISLITDINLIIKGKTWKIKRAGGETTINSGGKRMFPDVILYGDNEQTKLLQGWELKMPDVPINDVAFVEDAKRKADILGLNSCFIFNFTYGVLFIKDEETGKFKEIKKWDKTAHIKTRADVELYKDDWLKLIDEILIDINYFFEKGEFKTSIIGDVLSNNVMVDIIIRNQAVVANELKKQSMIDLTMKSKIDIWWLEVRSEYLKDETDMYMAYAKILLLNWIDKILFANVIKKYHAPAIKVEDIDYSCNPLQAINIFESITNKCDFYNIFSYVDYLEHIPKEVWENIIELNVFLKENGISHIQQADLQIILENTVRSSHRAIIGQYTTPKKLAEILVKITMRNINDTCLDPCCGTGTIPKAILEYKKELLKIEECYSEVFLSDKQSFPLQISNISLTDAQSINIPSRIFQSDVFNLEIGNEIEIVNPENGDILKEILKEFDCIISNLPFIDFVRNNANKKERNMIINKIFTQVKSDTRLELSDRSDLYAYIVIYLWQILKMNGRLSVITSNSWLGTEAGKQFFDIVRCYYNIEAVYISGSERWFNNAKVVTSILQLQKKEISNVLGDVITSFNIINSTLDELDNNDLMIKLINSSMSKKETDKSIMSVSNYNQSKIQEILNMNVSINSLFYNVSWLIDIKKALCKLEDYFTPFRGERTGQDEIFYLENTSDVDGPYVHKALKNTKNCKYLLAKEDTYIFNCDNTINELNALGHVKTIDYINIHKGHLNKTVAEKKDKWHMLGIKKKPMLFTGMNPNERLFYGKFDSPTIINQRLIGLISKKDIDIDLFHALLNSIVSMFYIEATGFGRGEGVLDISKDNIGKGFMLNPELLSNVSKKNIKDAFKPLLSREIKTIREELEESDRELFEYTVLKAYGIEKYYDQIKETLVTMVKNRVDIVR